MFEKVSKVLRKDPRSFFIVAPNAEPFPRHTDENRTDAHAAPCFASLDELEPRPLYSKPELCGGRVEGDEQLAYRD